MSPRPVKAHQHTDPRDSPKLNQVEQDGERIKCIYHANERMPPKPHTEPITRLQGDTICPVTAPEPHIARAQQAFKREAKLKPKKRHEAPQMFQQKALAQSKANRISLRAKSKLLATQIPCSKPRAAHVQSRATRGSA